MNKTKSPRKAVKITLIINLFQIISTLFVFALILLYMLQFLKMSHKNAYTITGTFFTIWYCLPLVSGFIIDRLLDAKKMIIIAQLSSIAGFLLLLDRSYLIISLASLSIGGAFFIPSMWSLLNSCFNQGDVKKSYYFTLAFISTGLGGIIATFAAGFLERYFGFKVVFYLGAIFNIIALVVFVIYHKVYTVKNVTRNIKHYFYACAVLIITFLLLVYILNHPYIAEILIYFIAICLIVYFIYLSCVQPTVIKKKGVLIYFVYCVLCVVYWIMGVLAQTNIIDFTQNNTNRAFSWGLFPSGSIQFFFFCSIFFSTILVAYFWDRKASKNNFSNKILAGIIIAGLGTAIIPLFIYISGVGEKSPFSTVVIYYLILGIGASLVQPSGNAAVGEYIPEKHRGFALGIWQYSGGLGALISIHFSLLTVKDTQDLIISNLSYCYTYSYISAICIAIFFLFWFILYKVL